MGDRQDETTTVRYIPPGDHREEFYRLGTFGKFPTSVPVSPSDLAAAGYYYTGYKDRVKCFSCGITVENWIIGDDGMALKWHRNDCPMKQGTERFNFALPTPNFHSLFRDFKGIGNPILGSSKHGSNSQAAFGSSDSPADPAGRVTTNSVSPQNNFPKLTLGRVVNRAHENYLRHIDLRQEWERRKTFVNWPSFPAPCLVSALAKEGFFYLGNLDRTQCMSCSGVLRNWAPHDIVAEQHRKHFPNCLIVRGRDAGNILMSDIERQRLDAERQTKLYQLNSNEREPPNPTADEQRQLARQFPCDNAVNPHMQSLQRRIDTFDRRWQNIKASVEQIAKAGFFFLGEGDKTKCFYCNGGLRNWDPNDEPWTEHAKWFPGCEYLIRQKGIKFVARQVEAYPNLTRPQIRNAVSYNDIPPSPIQRASPNRSAETEVPINSNLNLVIGSAIPRSDLRRNMDAQTLSNGYESSVDTYPGNKHETGEPAEKITNMVSALESSKLAESLRELEREGKCRKCRLNETEVCVLPCGHLCLCKTCTPKVELCPICNVKIQNIMRVFRV